MDLLTRVREYVYPVGRLDYDSDGLLLLTSDGELAARLKHPRHGVPRVYEAIVAGDPEDSALAMLRRGLYLEGDDRRPTAPAGVRRGTTIGKGRQQTTKLTITLNEGRNRQIRKMCAQIGHPVRSLTRVRMGPIALRDLRPGEWRDLTPFEIGKLKAAG
jgi:pseudouridine synthase